MTIKSWMAIAIITFLVSLGANLFTSRSDRTWFMQLRRPRWLTFESLIPIIWSVILVCGGISAYLVWESGIESFRGWLMMGFYLLLEIVIIAYVPITLRSRNLKLGTWVGLIGFGMGVVLTLEVWQISSWAALLLLPYLIWSPIGSYATWAIARLNPT
jgi:translocator protein